MDTVGKWASCGSGQRITSHGKYCYLTQSFGILKSPLPRSKLAIGTEDLCSGLLPSDELPELYKALEEMSAMHCLHHDR